MIQLRLRTRVAPEELAAKVGKIVTPADANLLLTGPARVLLPTGRPLCVYVPGALDPALLDASYATLHALRRHQTDNRGLASGTPRATQARGERTRAKTVASAIIGAFEAKQPFPYCRLTAWSGQEWDTYAGLFPLFVAIGRVFAAHVPDRYAAQMAEVARTDPAWVIAGTPFTTITVNNTYPTGVHQDAGDLDQGYSCLAVLRYGQYAGGHLTFPEYRVACDLGHGDVLLMDAHQWHGNTALSLGSPDAERISVVCYYRTKMAACGSPAAEQAKAVQRADHWADVRQQRDASMVGPNDGE